MRRTRHRRPDRTFAVIAPAALTHTRTDVVVPALVLLCWVLIALLALAPRRRHRTYRDDGWYASVAGPAVEEDVLVDGPSRRPTSQHLDGAALVATTYSRELPTLADVAGHAIAVAQLDDLLAPVLHAGRRPYRRPFGGVLVHGGTAADRGLLVRAVAGEHEVPLLTIRATTLGRSPVDSAVEAVFAHARAHAPCVLVVTDLDALAEDVAAELRRVCSDLLTHLRRVAPAERLAVVGLLSDADVVPRPLLDIGGFDRSVAVGALTAAERERIIRREVLLHAAAHDGDLQASVLETDGMTASQLQAAVAAAVRSVRSRSAVSGGPVTVTPRDLRASIDAASAVPTVAPQAFGSTIACRLQSLVAQLDDDQASPAIALLGASGNGKTTAARWVAQRCDRRVVWITCRDITMLRPEDLDVVVDAAAAQAPVLVVLDGVDEALAALDGSDRKPVVAAVERLLAARRVGLLLTARDRWTPPYANHLDDQIESYWLRHPTYHERIVLIRHAHRDAHPSTIATLAAQLHGATRRDVVETVAVRDVE